MSKTAKPSGVRLVCVDGDRAGQRLDNFLSTQLKGVPKGAIYKMIRTGQVRINGGRGKASTRLEEGDVVRIPPAHSREQETVTVSDRVLEQLEESVLYEDQDLVVVDKPSGMAVHSGSGLSWGLIDAVRQARPDEFLELVHRLDRATSGCLVLARNGSALKRLSAQFRDGLVQKRYLCLLDRRMPQALIEVDAPLRKVQSGDHGRVEVSDEGKAALTRFHLLQAYPDCSYAEAELFTGRTHQIRAHARHIGQPLAGDASYSGRESLKKWKRRGLNRIFLHAHQLTLQAPTGEPLTFHAPLPEALRKVLDELDR